MSEEREPMGNAKTQKITKSDGTSFEILKLVISPDFLARINEWAMNHDNWASVDIMQRREPSAKGYTHYAKLNTYEKPKEEKPKEERSYKGTLADHNDRSDNVPF